MDVHLRTVDGVDDSVDGGGACAFLSVDGEEPSHAAVRAVGDAHVGVEGHAQSRVSSRLAEVLATGEGIKGPVVPRALGDGCRDCAMLPVWMIDIAPYVAVVS